jgi:hypothetical protein
MSWVKVAVRQLICDDCGGHGPTALSRSAAALEAVAVGWTHTGSPWRSASRWRCPRCQEVRICNGSARERGRPSR